MRFGSASTAILSLRCALHTATTPPPFSILHIQHAAQHCYHIQVLQRVHWRLWCGPGFLKVRWAVQIRQQEIAARKSIASNPVKMDAIKREVAQIKAAQEAVKAHKKAAKTAKKEAKRAKKDERKAEKRHAKLKVCSSSVRPSFWSRETFSDRRCVLALVQAAFHKFRLILNFNSSCTGGCS